MHKKSKVKVCMFVPIYIVGTLLFLTGSCNKSNSGIVTDIDGNVYHTVRVGSQVWMVENLKVTRYRNGNLIPNMTDTGQWCHLSFGAYCNYGNKASNIDTYGRLYNWYAINDSRNIAPKGWHVPNYAELETLVNYLGGNTRAGSKMKEPGTVHWLYPNISATNESGFTALPGGYRYKSDGSFHTIGSNGYWWTTMESFEIFSWDQMIFHHFADVKREPKCKTYGFSVRCVKD